MKDYYREYPLFSLCGLNCALCPMHLGGCCPGCGGGEGNQPCARTRCACKRERIEFCFDCERYPCEKYEGFDEYDSFITHRNRHRDLERAKEMGIDAYRAELAEKSGILAELLENFNDGRRKSFYCAAVNLLALKDLRIVMKGIAEAWKGSEDFSVKEKAALAAKQFQDMAAARGVDLKLRKKPKM